MHPKPRQRLAIDHALHMGASVLLEGNPAHYLAHVLRAQAGEHVALFNRTDGEWLAQITEVKKKSVLLQLVAHVKPAQPGVDMWVAFAPIKGGRLETIIEKATELGAAQLHPVLTQRTIVDKVNAERAESIAREAAEQCERTDWPLIHTPQKLAQWLGHFPADRVLIYGDETGGGITVSDALNRVAPQLREPLAAGVSPQGEGGASPPSNVKWAILAGPEGGFTPEELAMLRHCKQAQGVSLGPRILRADTAIITLAAMTLAAWGDWHRAPRFEGGIPS
jgi:16S rRNA (uracil1498-N3)-methyltransferase